MLKLPVLMFFSLICCTTFSMDHQRGVQPSSEEYPFSSAFDLLVNSYEPYECPLDEPLVAADDLAMYLYSNALSEPFIEENSEVVPEQNDAQISYQNETIPTQNNIPVVYFNQQPKNNDVGAAFVGSVAPHQRYVTSFCATTTILTFKSNFSALIATKNVIHLQLILGILNAAH